MLQENTPSLYTERLFLRKFTVSDIPALFRMLQDSEMNTFLPWFPLKNITEAEQFLEKNFLSYYKLPSAYRYAICKKEKTYPISFCLHSSEICAHCSLSSRSCSFFPIIMASSPFCFHDYRAVILFLLSNRGRERLHFLRQKKQVHC